jgi:hypothetical protein
VETLRCPTCLTLLLDGGETRCPACHSKLRKRGAPIVLGESQRITNRPRGAFERELQARAREREDEWRSPVAKTNGRVESPTTPPSPIEPLFTKSNPAPDDDAKKDRRQRRTERSNRRREQTASADARVDEIADTAATIEVEDA